jgi:hypothetical protein
MAVKIDDSDRPPRRTLDKKEAIRHLIHTSIRMIMRMEDPFAIHLLVHSADKMILDAAKVLGRYPKVDWELYIKDEFHSTFFKRHRETYNYFKHAKSDFGVDLPVHDIMMLNVMTLFIASTNYGDLFGDHTDHMTLFLTFVMNLMPEIIIPNAATAELIKGVASTQNMTPSAFFEAFENNSQMLPRFFSEASKDMQDIVDFYHLSFAQLRSGQTRSNRIFRLPDY